MVMQIYNMGEIADGLINGDFDSLTGEYLGEGFGFPRTTDWNHAQSTGIAYIGNKPQLVWKDIPYDQHDEKFGKYTISERAKYGVVNFLRKKNITPIKAVELIEQFLEEQEYDLDDKFKYIFIQKNFKKFRSWIKKNIG